MSFDHPPDYSDREPFAKRIRKFGKTVLTWLQMSGNAYYPFPYMSMNPMMHLPAMSYKAISETPITEMEIDDFRAQLDAHDTLSELARNEP